MNHLLQLHHWLTNPAFLLLCGFGIGFLTSKLFSFRKRTCDEADERRKAFKDVEFPSIPSTVSHHKGWAPNSRGMLLYEQQFIPKGEIRGVVGICHGFSDHNNLYNAELAIKFCDSGYAVICCDLEGHGYSDGMHAYVEDLKQTADDCCTVFAKLLERKEFKKLPFFVYGESMGGAISFYVCTSKRLAERITGVILTCPMVKVSDDLKPPEIVISFLRMLAVYFPYAPLVPVPDIMNAAFKNKDVMRRCLRCPLNYIQKPRLRTGMACIDATDDIAARMEELSHPVLILHGDADKVTCPKISQQLHDRCSSTDKTINIYPDAWHNLMHAEPEHVSKGIFRDVVEWMNDRL